MKNHAILLAALGLTLGSLHAQTVPLYINYQGRVTDGTNTPLGSTGTAPNFTAAPINRKVIFRIYDAVTGGNRLWSEQQTATISLGEFSVLLGQGTQAVYNGNAENPRPALDTVFTGGGAVPGGPQRYLEVVVDDGDGTFTTDAAIIPRQQISTHAYSFRAAMADTVPNSAITANALATGSVTALKIVDSAITTEKIANLSILTEDMANNSITAAKIADGSITAAKIPDGAVTAAKLNSAIGVWDVSANHVYRPAGRVGIGKVPTVPLDVVGAIATTGQITAAGNITAGANITATGSITGSSITTTGPFSATNITADGAVRARMGVPGTGGTNNNGFLFSGSGATGMFSTVAGQLEFFSNNGQRMVMTPTGLIGIGTATPEVPLDVVGSATLTMEEQPYDGYNGTWNATTFTPNGLTGALPNGITLVSIWDQNRIDWGGSTLVKVTTPIGIRSNSWIASRMGFQIYSDRRIKRDSRASASAEDLATIQKLKVTDYRMVDPADGGTAWRKGFIAQEVEKVIPEAVTRSTEFVPDIFSEAASLIWNPGRKTLFVTLKKDHELKAGDRVRLHMDGQRVDLDVSATPSAREFEVEKCEAAPKKVFVYGKQVHDFRTVDYDRIFTTSVGALQELKREKDVEVKALQEENARLHERLAALEASDKARDAKLAAIEKLLLSAEQSAVSTATLPAIK